MIVFRVPLVCANPLTGMGSSVVNNMPLVGEKMPEFSTAGAACAWAAGEKPVRKNMFALAVANLLPAKCAKDAKGSEKKVD